MKNEDRPTKQTVCPCKTMICERHAQTQVYTNRATQTNTETEYIPIVKLKRIIYLMIIIIMQTILAI